jgi:Fe-S cluster biogenesis protein NfuA
LLPGSASFRDHASHRRVRSFVVDSDKVSEVIEVIRPAIQADGGDIFLRGVDPDAGVVTVELVGACVSCPASTVTLKAGIERILKDRVPGVTEVVDAGAPTETSVGLGL